MVNIIPGAGTAFSKLYGQETNALYTTNMTGNFIPSTGIQSSYWDNQVGSGKNLRRFNGIPKSNTVSCHFWLFDGSNDYLGPAESGYGGDPFLVNGAQAFTMAQWYKHINNARHIAFSLTYSSSNVMTLWTGSRVNNQMTLEVDSGGRQDFTNFTFSNNTWYYIAVVHHGSNQFSFFVNGSFVESTGSVNITDNTASTEGEGGEAEELQIGKIAGRTYTAANIKVGHVHIYNAALKSSQLRQNCLATHDINNQRIYGADFTR